LHFVQDESFQVITCTGTDNKDKKILTQNLELLVHAEALTNKIFTRAQTHTSNDVKFRSWFR